MTYQISWLVPERVIELVVPEVFSGGVERAVDADMNALLATTTNTVHILCDLRGIKQFPSATESMNTTYYRRANMGTFLTIGMTSNPVMRFLSSLVARGFGVRFKDFNSREEALAYLASVEHL